MAFLDPQKVVGEFEIKPGMIVADLGCGPGYFSVEIAKLVKDGKVYAIDVQKEVLEVVRSRAKKEQLSNVETIWADLEVLGSTKLKDDLVDFVLISNALFQLEEHEQFAKEALRILKSKGSLAVIEQENLFPKEKVEKLFLSLGFNIENQLYNVGDKHYGILFRKA